MKIKLLPALLLRRELLVPMCALLATGIRADGALATGVSGNWRAFALSGGKDALVMDGTSLIFGDAAVSGADYGDTDDDDDNTHNKGSGMLRTFKLSGDAVITGKLAYDTRTSGKVTGNATVQGGYQSNWPTDSQLINEANMAKAQALYYCGLSNTGFSSLDKIKTSSSLTLSGTSGLNVLNLSELSLSGNAILTLAGTMTSQFVINVDKKFSLAGNSQIALSGGVDPLNVIFNYKGDKATMSGNTSLNGVLMAVDGKFEASGNAMVQGQVIAGKIKLTGNAKIVSP
jgi:choice-of-anchor A domain-containing protein